MDRVKNYIADTQEEKRHVAYVHCHADQIKLGNTQLLFVCNEIGQNVYIEAIDHISCTVGL
jgi:adenosyl cobinamide kinase/adenosyl cobinamide phosphate guanylyltransferase